MAPRRRQLSRQPGFGQTPGAHDRALGDRQRLRRLLDAQAPEKAHLHHLALPRIDLTSSTHRPARRSPGLPPRHSSLSTVRDRQVPRGRCRDGSTHHHDHRTGSCTGLELTHAELMYTAAIRDITPSGTTKLIRYTSDASGATAAEVTLAASPSITTSKGPTAS